MHRTTLIQSSLRLAVAAVLCGCSAQTAAVDAPIAGDAFTVEAADWTLGWTDATTPGWSTTTDLGYVVTVESGWVVDYSVTLSPCAETAVASRSERALSLLGIGTARADHPDFTDPSQVELVTAESLAESAAVVLETRFEPAEYCGLHMLLARGEEDTIAPDGESAFGYSLKLRGTWSKDGASGALDLATNWANARDWTWADVVVAVSEPAESYAADIAIERDPRRLFDGLDLAAAGPEAVVWGVLENLFDRATVTVVLTPAGGA